jgi:hypothetical protein
MATSTQAAGRTMNEGLYLRMKSHIRSLGWRWGMKKSTNFAEVEAERPWAGLAEWLRAAHSLLDEQTGELTRNTD